MNKKQYDLAIIGAGPGGYVAALKAAELGLKTVCIDKRNSPGGTCLHVGCIPSKSLLYASELYAHLKKEGSELGLGAEKLKIDFSQMMVHKQKTIDSLVGGINTLFGAHDVTFLGGEASFISPHSIQVSTRDETQEIEAAHFLVASGSEPIALPFLPFDEKQILSSTGILNLEKIPETLLVIGAGVIGVELASVYQRLGTKVTIIEMLDHICPSMDKLVSRTLLRVLKAQGIEFKLSTKITSAELGKNIRLTLESNGKEESLESRQILVAVGRKPHCQGLGLEKIGIHISNRGFIPVDNCFRTSQPHIFAVGDVIEGPMLAHRASDEGTAVVHFIANKPFSINYMAIPNVIYTSPEAASVGMTEEEVIASRLPYKTGTAYFKANPRARCMLEMEGFVKIIRETTSGRLIGMHILGPQASELIAEGVIAMVKASKVEEIAQASHPHPTLNETIKEAAELAIRS